jgi:hypothetical protein
MILFTAFVVCSVCAMLYLLVYLAALFVKWYDDRKSKLY